MRTDYATPADLRAEFTELNATDAQLYQQLDLLSAYLEAQLGHTFGRALLVQAETALVLNVTVDKLICAGQEFSFTLYPTLAQLSLALSAVCQVELLAQVRPDTPSHLLVQGIYQCGPTYAERCILPISALYTVLTPTRHQSLLFVPLPVAEVQTTTSARALPSYTWTTGALWLTALPGQLWPAAAIHVTYVPLHWLNPPRELTLALLAAYGQRYNLAVPEEENFGDYAYRRRQRVAMNWEDYLHGSAVRRYAVRFRP